MERVKNGLRNARAKGKHIGRVKTRPSDLIRALLKSGMTLRATAKVARCSHGSVSLEKKLMKDEAKAIAKEQAEKQAEIEASQPQDAYVPTVTMHIS